MVGLRAGGVLVIERRPPAAARRYIGRFAVFFAGMACVLLLGLALAVRQTSRPVRHLAEAARRFSLDQQAPDLPMTGPREVRDLASAFNELQGRVRGLVAERTRLLAAIAHDLRTYLTRLRMRAEFIDDEDQRDRAERDIDEMAQLIDDTLLFAQRTIQPVPSQAATCDLMEEIQGVVAQRQELGEPVTLADERAAPGPLPVGCPAPSLRRMLNNLIDNAVRYGERARVAVKSSPTAAEVSVEDDGPGVPAGALAELAQPFLRLEASRGRDTGGAGLGLAIVESLAQSCGGAMELSNGPTGGLRALLKFPTPLVGG
jgi:signal transduction histidine kinase